MFKWFNKQEAWLKGALLLSLFNLIMSIICTIKDGPLTVPLNYMGLKIVLELFPVSFTGGIYPGLNSEWVLFIGIIINTIIFFFIGGFLGWMFGEIGDKIHGHVDKKVKKKKGKKK